MLFALARRSARSEVATHGLFSLDGFEQGLEVAGAKALVIPPLNHFEEEGGTILERLREDLQQVALLVVVYEDLLALQDVDVLLHLNVDSAKALAQLGVVRVRNLLQELNTAGLHSGDGLNDAFSAHSDVLDASATVVLAVFLDLALFHAVSGLVDRHLDLLVEVGHDDGTQRRVLSVNHFVVNRPEAVEVEHLLVPSGDGLHFAVFLVPDAMVHV